LSLLEQLIDPRGSNALIPMLGLSVVFLRSFRSIAWQAETETDLDLKSFSDLPFYAPRGKGE
jgi:hypothetical protein